MRRAVLFAWVSVSGYGVLYYEKKVSIMQKAFRILLCLCLIGLLCGFFICTTSPNNVPVGIAVTVVGCLFGFCAIIPAGKLIQQSEKEKTIE